MSVIILGPENTLLIPCIIFPAARATNHGPSKMHQIGGAHGIMPCGRNMTVSLNSFDLRGFLHEENGLQRIGASPSSLRPLSEAPGNGTIGVDPAPVGDISLGGESIAAALGGSASSASTSDSKIPQPVLIVLMAMNGFLVLGILVIAAVWISDRRGSSTAPGRYKKLDTSRGLDYHLSWEGPTIYGLSQIESKLNYGPRDTLRNYGISYGTTESAAAGSIKMDEAARVLRNLTHNLDN
ncbi:hypothetical protein B0H17DRAFT_1148117 [Mycena rosella]|uniref:Uncharacterized protein n=1 Tax=Mycena rosella TaxID=1033263 RepID=A0AAD7G199_MYCRO|nr:hypothetical protein B0H17DRAFT_1148117 [Mycena rosella]